MNLRSVFFCTLVVLGSLAAPLRAQEKSAPQTVLDYFLAVPDEYVGAIRSAGKRAEMIEVKDLKNGYLKLSAPGWDGWGEAALFRNSDGTKTLGLQTIGCGPACGTESLFFVRFKDGEWTDVTKKVLPEVGEDELLRVMKCIRPKTEDSVIAFYELPRVGTTVRLIDDNNADQRGKVLYEFAWDGAKFTAKATRNQACKIGR